jgi:hypothetical protein
MTWPVAMVWLSLESVGRGLAGAMRGYDAVLSAAGRWLGRLALQLAAALGRSGRLVHRRLLAIRLLLTSLRVRLNGLIGRLQLAPLVQFTARLRRRARPLGVLLRRGVSPFGVLARTVARALHAFTAAVRTAAEDILRGLGRCWGRIVSSLQPVDRVVRRLLGLSSAAARLVQQATSALKDSAGRFLVAPVGRCVRWMRVRSQPLAGLLRRCGSAVCAWSRVVIGAAGAAARPVRSGVRSIAARLQGGLRRLRAGSSRLRAAARRVVLGRRG